MSGLETTTAIILATIGAGTPLVFAALGELITEKSGVLNLGVEGMMLVGAIAGFVVAVETGNVPLAALAGMLAGAAMALLFGILTLTFMANQVASGLALTIFGIGLSAFLGLDYTSVAFGGVPEIHIPLLSDIPLLGIVFSLDLLVYASFVVFLGIVWFLYRTRAGLALRAIGEAPHSAHALGYPVIRIRYLAVLFGGAMAGLGGVYLSIAYTPMWVEGMTAGRGWIALALVVFSTWRPLRVLAGAYLFGGVTIIQFHAQGAGVDIPSQFLSMLPYLATIAVLVVISRDIATVRLHQPAALGTPFHPDTT
ncbi:MAG: ABC transporter permease [Gammaproteobacteria bacterium]|nr:ABC transporter permease [Gammaproteobacteria bacterium]NIR88830.1 ABC transporter permease [Gammaproteobacteria bacterium]NIU06434.1 ABC transporter permease [Gammaproteobacteria bacterium]NIV53326.1 ABC transporter permease [Gammaproteobacteria bacterium]NIV74045.1 ABC transporter permease [Gammaproteobacteria bacterium]